MLSNTGSSAFQFLRNVTSGSFLEADQLREINVPLQPHACNAVLQRIIDEECDITQKYFRFHHSNYPQLTGGLSEESEHVGEPLKAELEA